MTREPVKKSYNGIASQEKQLKDFVKSLGTILEEIPAVEINTMVVGEITGENFIPWEAYRDIYAISRQYLAEQEIHESLRDRYLALRKNLELEYALLLSDPSSDFYEQSAVREVNPILNHPNPNFDAIETRLPSPMKSGISSEIIEVQMLLHDSRFLRSLRKLRELKTSLDYRNKLLLKNPEQKPGINDIIFAQTIIQIDGNIINRYAQEIFDHPQQEILLKIHKHSVEIGQKQWRGLLGFILEIFQRLI
ncbi:MAG: hypothetical protein DSM107014_12730 [Gomphosphaeria aponina SAG 52.96 = DSM 107014]|uniref:Uncharacterized protein n=1 Tax=Gomphosphaeria aponina SAG 52.96 = DSM 107014 TaxID=1521640 RepID=A0A941GR02_9CHRO|nr:hypothetical protein [Gomphosphaeria aponina SAG 52.96 = DSM 107014]